MKTDGCIKSDLPVSCFNLITQEQWETLSVGRKVITYKKGELLIKRGLTPNQVIFITEGFVLKYIETDEERAVNVDILREGDFIGIQSILGVTSCNYTFKALTNIKACVINTALLKSLLESNSNLALRLLKRAAEDENALMEFHARLTYKQMAGRLALTLLFLTENRLKDINVFRLLTRKDIADFAGISHINTTKILKEFEREEIIKLVDKDIYIVKRELLERYAQIG
ncbi:MAG: Crp/Fnr family transcriptional regulator [Bacteroidales bacterium]|nr:Crp/Fnr family transcriptional regulator [Bacteroidales bacterium]